MTLIGAGIRGIVGRSAVVSMALHSYVADQTANEMRTRIFGRLLSMNFFGCFIGSFLGGALLDFFDFSIVFCFAIFTMCVCVFVCALFMKENINSTYGPKENVEKGKGDTQGWKIGGETLRQN